MAQSNELGGRVLILLFAALTSPPPDPALLPDKVSGGDITRALQQSPVFGIVLELLYLGYRCGLRDTHNSLLNHLVKPEGA